MLTDPSSGPSAATRYRDVLLVVLTLTTGAVDAVTFVRLGQVFSSVITGNLALHPGGGSRHETALFTGLALRQKPEGAGRSTAILVTAVAGAALGTLAALNAPGWVPAAVLIPIAVVLAGALARRWPPTR